MTAVNVQQRALSIRERQVLDGIRELAEAGEAPTLTALVEKLDISELAIARSLNALKRMKVLHPNGRGLLVREPNLIAFSVDGRPRPKGSKDAFVRDGRVRLVESSGANLAAWSAIVCDVAGLHRPLAPWRGPVRAEGTFWMGPQRGDYDVPIGRPDADKLLRALLDAIQKAGIVEDDAQIYDPHFPKLFHPEGRFGVDVRLELLPRSGGAGAT